MILMVDDNRHGVLARRTILEELGHELHVASDPREALELFAKRTFDLVITDYKMPYMNGVEFIGKAREINPAVPVILVSGYVDALGLTEENTGSDAVIQKSANEVPQLLRAVNRLLRKKTKKPATSAKSQDKTPKTRAKGGA
jgi:CheY-like chemotaxis protein